MAGARKALPRLNFQLMGNWRQLALGNDDTITAAVRAYVREAIGSADSDTQLRSVLRARFTTTLITARDAGAVSVFVASEITAGTPMPIMLTIFSPRELRMTPATGTSAQAVKEMLRMGLTQLQVEGVENATELSITGSEILRIRREQAEPIHPDAPDELLTNLVVDYWYTVPGSKQVVLANFATPLADIPEIMVSFFDATVRASSFIDHDA
ncbi:MAG: hypothetical protein ACRCSP_09635 [Rhodoglobus sp.]